jgi:hypothetical protein
MRVLEIPDFVYTQEYVEEMLLDELIKKVSKDKITSVKLRETLSFEDETTIRAWEINGVYPTSSGLYVNPEELMQVSLFAQKYTEIF